MNFEILRNSALVENLGWTLVHSIWQIGLIALALFLILRSSKNFSANARYLSAVSALVFTLILPLSTFFWLENNAAQNQFANKLYDIEDAKSIKNKPTIAETVSPLPENKSQIGDLPNKTAFFSLDDLQETLKANVANALPVVVLLWIFGVGFSAFRLTGGIWQLHKYKTREVSAPEKEWQKKFTNLCEKLQIIQTVRLLQSNLIKTPIVVGWLKPVILIPASVFLQMNPRELETILAHELLHIRRLDNLINFTQSFAEILFFYHPCGWWISAVIRREREFACDAAVLETLESEPFVYASALANLEEIRLRAKQSLPSVSMAATGGKLMQRIEKILQKNAGSGGNSKQTLWSAAGLAFLLVSTLMLTVFWSGTGASVNAQTKITNENKKIAVGFVSIPPLDRMTDPPKDADATARLMIANLKARKIPAIGFVQGGLISDGEKLYPVRANIVRLWRDAGLEIGIGGYKHIWFYDTPLADYIANAEKNERVVKQILAEKNLPLHYFSYPFLGTGKTAEDNTQFENWLGTRGLRSVKYTLDNQEWMYSYAYDEARKDNDIKTMKEIQAEFVDYMTKMTDHYEAYSAEMFGRDIAQTMVLTPSRLVADSFDDVFGMLEKRGYQFVSMDEAQKDEAYNTPEKIVDSKSGISWFERWQMARGKKLRDEPRVAASVWKIWNERKK
ncbi:MAG TPA: M56 family metallopeptidase [Pyrinomonadaceae bacterium]|nr:M56 family metallopeptidase [Pyrinomonadaceae bacterium]